MTDFKPLSWLNSYAGFHKFTADDKTLYGGFEVYWHDDNLGDPARPSLEEAPDNSGWYWHSCQPGCLPDGDPSGPFVSSFLAYEDADPNWHLISERL